MLKKKSKFALIKDNFLLFLAAVVILAALNTFIKNLGREDRIKTTVQKLETLKKEQESLLQTRRKVETKEFIEKEVREKLGLAKPEEVVVVLPKEEVLRRLAPLTDEEEEKMNIPIWRRWIELFF